MRDSSLRRAAVLVGFVLALIALSALTTAVLKLPACKPPEVQPEQLNEYAVVAAGAVTNTGIDAIGIASSLSGTGQAVLLAAMQLGTWAWLIAGGCLLMQRPDRRKVLALANLVMVLSVVIELVAALALWPAVRGFDEALFLSVSAFTNTGYTLGQLPHPAVQLAALGPLIVLGQVMIIAFDGGASLKRALVFLAAVFIAVAAVEYGFGQLTFTDAALAGLYYPTGFFESITHHPGPVAVFVAANGGVWLATRKGHRAFVALMILVAARYVFGTFITRTLTDDHALMLTALSHSGLDSYTIRGTDVGERVLVVVLMLVGRVLPLALLAWVVSVSPTPTRAAPPPAPSDR